MPAPRRLKIAAAQYPIGEPKTLLEWEAKMATWVATGAATGAQLLVFPEYAAIEQAASLGPQVSADLKQTLAGVADLTPRRVTFHAGLARQHGVHILVGSGPARRTDGCYVNAAQLVAPSGAVGVQHKLIMTPFERDWGVMPGRSIRVFDTALGRIGIAICYDSEFPLLVRAMAEAGAELLLVPSCTERLSGFHRIRAAAAFREHDRLQKERRDVVLLADAVEDAVPLVRVGACVRLDSGVGRKAAGARGRGAARVGGRSGVRAPIRSQWGGFRHAEGSG